MDLESIFYHSMDYTYKFDDLQMSIWFIGLTMIIVALAFVASLAFELPFAKLETMLIGAIMGKPSQKPRPRLADITQENQLGGEKADGDKLAPNTEVPETKPVKIMLKDIKGKKKSFAKSLSKTDFYSRNIDVSSPDDAIEHSTTAQLHSSSEENGDSKVT